MIEFFLTVIETSVTMSVIVLLVLLLFHFFGKKIKAKSRYIILAIVIFRLAIPIGISGVPSVFDIKMSATPSNFDDVEVTTGVFETQAETDAKPIDANIALVDSLPIINTDISSIKETYESTIRNNAFETVSVPETTMPVVSGVSATAEVPEDAAGAALTATAEKKMAGEDWFNLIRYVYFIGVGVFFLGSLLAHFIYIQRIKKGRTLGEEHVYSIYADVCRNNGITNPPLIWESTASDSPMIIGLFVPRVVLPAGLDKNALSGMLAHELKHYTRYDLWIKFLCLAARSLHWFNPIVHIAALCCMQEMELSCDAEVLANTSIDERREYGEAMLDVIRNCKNRGVALTTHFSPRRKAVKARFVGIMDTELKKRGLWMIVFTVSMSILAGFLFSCSFSVTNNLNFEQQQETTVESSQTVFEQTVASPITTTIDTAVSLIPAETTVDVPETTAVAEITAPEETTPEETKPEETTKPTETEPVVKPPVPTTPRAVDMFDSGAFKVIEYRTADDSLIYWDVHIYNGQTITYVLEDDVSYCPSAEEIASFEDVNFDGHNDLLICKGGYGVQGTVSYHCYLYTDSGYVICPSFAAIPNPVIDSESHIIKGTYRENASKSVTEYYIYSNGSFVLDNRGDESSDVFYYTDFSNANVINDFKVLRGEWAVRDGRLWMDNVLAKDDTLIESCGYILYQGDGWESLRDYQVDVDIYNVQTQTGILTRCDLNQANSTSSNSFYGYFSFVSKTGKRGAHGFGNVYGNWGGNIVVSNEYFTPGMDLHLTVTAIGDELRCVFSDLQTGYVILDLSCATSYWYGGTFGFRMLNKYEYGNSSLGVTSFDNLRVTEIS